MSNKWYGGGRAKSSTPNRYSFRSATTSASALRRRRRRCASGAGRVGLATDRAAVRVTGLHRGVILRKEQLARTISPNVVLEIPPGNAEKVTSTVTEATQGGVGCLQVTSGANRRSIADRVGTGCARRTGGNLTVRVRTGGRRDADRRRRGWHHDDRVALVTSGRRRGTAPDDDRAVAAHDLLLDLNADALSAVNVRTLAVLLDLLGLRLIDTGNTADHRRTVGAVVDLCRRRLGLGLAAALGRLVLDALIRHLALDDLERLPSRPVAAVSLGERRAGLSDSGGVLVVPLATLLHLRHRRGRLRATLTP